MKQRRYTLIIWILIALLVTSCSPATPEPTATTAPTEEPTEEPTPMVEPTEEPTEEPTPTTAPTEEPTEEPTPTTAPTEEPTEESTPTVAPTDDETAGPAPDLSDPELQEQLLAFQTMVFINFNASGIMFTASQASSPQTLAQARDAIFNEAFAAIDRAFAELEPVEELEPAWQQAQTTHEQVRELTNQAVAGQITLTDLAAQLQGLDTSYGETAMNYLMEEYGFTEEEILEYANTFQTTILETFGE